MAPPTDVLLACARHLGLLDVVVLLDGALRSGEITRSQLAGTLATRRFGVRRLRAAAALADPRAESPYESLLRVLHVACEAHVVPQFKLWSGGRFVARGDLRLTRHRVFHEYDGADHREKDQQREDLGRDRAISAVGWVRRGYTDRELFRRPVTILRDIDMTLGRPHDPGRLDAWYSLLRESCFTAAGRQRLLERLGLAEPASRPA
jgi:very-short-patch-repair endonuclease